LQTFIQAPGARHDSVKIGIFAVKHFSKILLSFMDQTCYFLVGFRQSMLFFHT